MRNRFTVALVAGCLAFSAVVAVAPHGAASTDDPERPVTIAGIGKATQIRAEYPAVWVHFRPVLSSPAVEIRRAGSNVATICYQSGEGRAWNVIYDHSSKRVGYTYEEYLTVRSDQSCWNVGQKAGDPFGETWVHLYPRADWAHESIWPGHDIARICILPSVYDPSDGSTRQWGLFLDHDNLVVGFTWDASTGAPHCD